MLSSSNPTNVITLDVVFHEDLMYSSEPELQGEYQKEIQTLDYDDYISEDVGSLKIFEDMDNTFEDVDVHIYEDMGSLDISEEGEFSEIVNQ